MNQSVVREGNLFEREGHLLGVYSREKDVYWEFIREGGTFIGRLFEREGRLLGIYSRDRDIYEHKNKNKIVTHNKNKQNINK